MNNTCEILQKILLPLNCSWDICDVVVDELKGEIYVKLDYKLPFIEVCGKRYGIYDHRPERSWRHLDFWQYKTYISASLPRYKDEHGFYHSVEVPWAESGERMSILLEKKS
ncbi:transposase family protein [Bacteroidales bacterium OttesenSCG-928-I21]|nr:transposase family protein [Bacteroidales bacterium OttesenSCG-928-I21]